MNRNRKITVYSGVINYHKMDKSTLNKAKTECERRINCNSGKTNGLIFSEVSIFWSSKWAVTDHNLYLFQELVDFTLLAL